MKIHPFTAAFPRESCRSEEFFANAKENYRAFWDEGCFEETIPAVFVYQIEESEGKRTGLVAAVNVGEYLEGNVKRHEHTLAPKEQRQLQLLLQRRASVKPVLLAHPHLQELANWLEERAQGAPLLEVDFPSDRQYHRLWALTEEADIHWVQGVFERHVDTLYIADGHHRFSSAARLYERLVGTPRGEQYNALMCALFPTSALDIHNFNRVVSYNQPASPLALMARLSAFGEVRPLEQPTAPRRPHEMTFCLEGEWFAMTWHPAVLARHAEAGLPVQDVSLLNRCILEDIMGLEDIRDNDQIKYLEGPRGLLPLELKADERGGVAFCLHPLQWDAFLRVIDHGHVLPPKSTWFEPRMKNGLIVQPFHD